MTFCKNERNNLQRQINDIQKSIAANANYFRIQLQTQEEKIKKELNDKFEVLNAKIQTLEFGNLLVEVREDICDQLGIYEREFMKKDFNADRFKTLKKKIKDPPLWLHWKFVSCVKKSIQNRNTTAHESVATIEQAREKIRLLDAKSVKYFDDWSKTKK